jgi:hypothetical protein
MDPQSEKYKNISPYNYVENNPLRFIDPKGDTIVATGTAAEIKQINSALEVLKITNPDEYNAVQSSKLIVPVSLDALIERKVDNSTSSSNTISFAGTEAHEDLQGKATIETKSYDDLQNDSPDPYKYAFSMSYDGKTREKISEEAANNEAFIESATITVDKGLKGKLFARILAHELGHTAFALLNKAKKATGKPDGKAGHAKGNPDGNAATKAEEEFNNNYDNAIEQLKEDKKKKNQ